MTHAQLQERTTVEDMRIDGDDQILKFAGPPIEPGMCKKLVQMGFGWDGEREAWVRRIPSIAEVEIMARHAMSQRFDVP